MSRKILITVIAVILLLAALSASVYFVTGASRTVVVSEADAGKTITLDAGQRLEVRLPGNQTTGFSWIPGDVDSAILAAQGEAEYAASSDLLGASGTFIFRYEAAGEGTQELSYAYLKPWESDVAPEQVFAVTIVVK
jgi:inhibitor of cysteine peptidase